eukprot:363418-Chlamydomonas_euryale.AAC.9
MVNPELNPLAEAASGVLNIPEDAAVVTGSDISHAETAVAQRCKELLAEMPTSLFQDLAAAWADHLAKGDEEGAYRSLAVIHHYQKPASQLHACTMEYTVAEAAHHGSPPLGMHAAKGGGP